MKTIVDTPEKENRPAFVVGASIVTPTYSGYSYKTFVSSWGTLL